MIRVMEERGRWRGKVKRKRDEGRRRWVERVRGR